MTSSPRIAVVGAGPAGLTLARLLHLSPYAFELTVYDRDASPTSRSDQGGTLDLHNGTGLAAIRKCGLWEAFQRHARYDGQEMKLFDKNATILAHKSSEGREDRPEIDRRELKEILLEGLPGSYVKWGYRLKEVTRDRMLLFEGKPDPEGPFDLIVGADGANSRVRPIYNGPKPAYAGVSGYEMEIPTPAKTCPHVDKLAGRGMFVAMSDIKMLNCQRMGDNSLKVRSWYLCPEGEAQQSLEKFGQTGTLKRIKERYNGWAPELLELLEHGDVNGLKHWTLYELPVGWNWEHKEGFTLMGDAASLMSPFGGEGVNKAMRDALELAELLERSQESANKIGFDHAVSLYEQRMFPRAKEVQTDTMNNKLHVFSPDAPIGLMAYMIQHMTSESNSAAVRLLGTKPFIAVLRGYLWARQTIGWAVRRFWRQT